MRRWQQRQVTFKALRISNSVLCILSEYSYALPISSSGWASGVSSTISVFKPSSVMSLVERLVYSNANSSVSTGVVSIRAPAWPMSLVAEDRWAARTFFLRARASSADIVDFTWWASIGMINCSVLQ